MAEQQTDPHDDKVRTVPLPADGGERVIAQENQSAEVAIGGGEWPSPDEPPTGPAPGDAVSRPAGSSRGPDRLSDEAIADDDDNAFPGMRDVLEADPVAGGSKSVSAEEGTRTGAGDATPAWPA